MKPLNEQSIGRDVARNFRQVAGEMSTLQTDAAALDARVIVLEGMHVGVRARRTGTFSLANVTNTTVAWDTEDYDTSGFHDNATNNSRLTVPTGLGGIYHFGYVFDFASASGVGSCWVTLNGGSTRFAWTQGANSGGLILHGSDFLSLNPGDYIQVFAYQNSGGAISAGSSGSMSFFMYRVGFA